tara:strand:+ start:49 stop:312 length:264 start_codon:yes stop_codon:yes gene_type:complete
MSKVTNVNLTQEGSTLASMTTTIDTVWAVNKVECYVDGFDSEQFLDKLNRGEFDQDFRVAHLGSDFTFFDDKEKAYSFLEECHKELI